MTIECKRRCEDKISRISVDRTLNPYEDGLKFCGICNIWVINSKEILNKVLPASSDEFRTERRLFLIALIENWFSLPNKLNKCPCCSTRLRQNPRRHTKRSEKAFRYESDEEEAIIA